MALFGSSKKEKPALKKVRPTVVRAQNIAKELLSLAKSYDIKADSLDFNILEIQTYTRVNDGTKETEWEEISHDELYNLDEKKQLLNPNFQIKQMYEIEIFSKKDEDPYKNFRVAVGANATKCKVYLSIAAGSEVEYNSRFDKGLLLLIQKRKMRAGVLVNIFDEMQEEVISKITAHVRVEEKAVYTQAETILISESYEPTPTINDALIMHFEKKEEVDEKEKVDYASRGFIKSVKEGELLIEYVKAKEGKPGRNCRGEFMTPSEPIIAHEPEFKVDGTIDTVDTDDSIKYVAKESGYISFEDGTYTIKTDVDIGEISFKTTGSISTGLDSGVSISVKETDAVKDAIGTGMEVEVSEIDVEGNVGSNAKVFARKANIGGQTHKTATIRADKLDINVHRGHAFGKNICITRLEHGEVDGDTVEITQALGGHIRAKDIEIGICASHVQATASRKIEIKKLQGSENIFTIDPLLKKDAQAGLDKNQDNIKDLEHDLVSIKKEIQKYTKLIKDGTASFLDIKKRLLHYKKSGVKMPESFVKKYKQFQQMQEHLKKIKIESEVKTDQLNLLTTRTVSFQDNIFDARIINRDKWIGHNELKFKLVDPPVEIVFKPAEGSGSQIFGLVEVDEGEYEIQAMKE
ncbi:MAG: flagellar assembly protein A [Campylobacterota bacterium]